jgi:MoaA/NifB/PqqE/SkfB family radical SAM enzyme
MPRVLVVFPPLRVSRDFIDYPYFADLGAVQAAAVLRAAGHEVRLVDALATKGAAFAAPGDADDAHVRLGVDVEATLALTRVASPDVLDVPEVILVAYTPFHRPPARDATLAALLVGLRAQAPAAPIVLGDLYQSGQHVVDVPSAQILVAYPEADAILRYEAEADLDALVRELAASGRPAVPFERRGGEPRIEELPLPAWDLVDLPAYWAFHESVMQGLGRGGWAFPIDRRSLPMLSSRGCPFRCTHCSSNPGRTPGAPKTQRRYSPSYLARALDALAAFGAERVHLLDELANVNEAHFDALLAALEARALAFEIPNGLRADYVLPKHLAAMRGKLTTLSVSAESGDARVVNDVVDKQLDLGAIRAAAERAKEAGIPLLVHFMIGLPGETKADINRTLGFAIDLHELTGAWPSVQFATPLPGTRLAEIAATRGRVLPLVEDWGPHFQKSPTVETDEFSLEDLRKFKWTFDRRLEAGQGARKVIMNATYRCNNRCTFCATGTRTQFDGDFEQQKAILRDYRARGVTLLDLDGGEPTLNPNLFQLIRYARHLGFEKVNVTTNGRLASIEGFAQKLVRSGVTSVLFSIHGHTAQIHAQNVGVAEAFEQTLEGVRNVVRLAPPGLELGANVTITKSNHKVLPEMAQLVWDLGLRWWNLQFLTPFGRATSHVCPDTQVAADVAMRVIDAWRDRLKFQVINLPFCFMPGYEEFLAGDLLKLERHMIFVNNDEVNLFEYLRERRSKKPVCKGCPHDVFCGGFYELDDVPEPTWLIAPEDLVRRPV